MATPATTTTTTTAHGRTKQPSHKGKQGLAGMLVFVNMAFFALTLALVSFLFDRWVERTSATERLFGESALGRSAKAMMATTFLSGAVGLATMIMAAVHAKNYTEGARFSSLGSNLVSFALTCLAAGFSIKTLIKIGTGNKYLSIAIVIAVFNLALFLTMLTYLMSLGLFKNKDEYATHYHNNATHYNTNATGTTTGVLPTHHNASDTKYVGGHEEPVRAMHA